MAFHFVKNSNKIHFGPTKFDLKEKNIIKNKFNFDRYETEPISDTMGSLYFNKYYGILGFDNGWGMQFHYLSDENNELFNLPIFFKMEDLE